MIFSWQSHPWQQLCRLQRENRLPHALLFTGPTGIGKRQFAHAFASWLLCQNAASVPHPCGHCHACHLMRAESHPDFYCIQPEQEGHMIKIEQIRALYEFAYQTAHQGGARLVLIQPATAMNTYAANALLKILEEPAPQTWFILISDHKTLLPVTITSRCQTVRFLVPSQPEAREWLNTQDATVAWQPILEAAQGAPLLAQQWHQQGVWPLYQKFMSDLSALTQQQADPWHLAMQWKEVNMLWVFDLFFQWLIQLMRAHYLPDSAGTALSTVFPESLGSAHLLEFVDYLQHMRAEVLGPYNLNQQLMLEALFIRWVQYVSR